MKDKYQDYIVPEQSLKESTAKFSYSSPKMENYIINIQSVILQSGGSGTVDPLNPEQ